jgi:hypothetical protein
LRITGAHCWGREEGCLRLQSRAPPLSGPDSLFFLFKTNQNYSAVTTNAHYEALQKHEKTLREQ